MRRRSVLVGAAVLVGLAGCAAGGGGSTDEVGTDGRTMLTTTSSPPDVALPNCDTPYRPTGENGSLEPAPYPERPASLADDAAVVRYAIAYEEAYVYNGLVERLGEDLQSASVEAAGIRAVDGPAGSKLVLVETSSHHQVEHGDDVIAGSGWDVPYVYFVNETTVVRARARGADRDGDRIDPDPLANGTVLECSG